MSYIVAAGILSPNAGLIFWITITFLLLLFVLRRFAWGPITQALETRERKIAEAMARAEEALAEARKIQADNDRARREAEQEAQRILREAREAAERLRAEEVEKTRAQIRQMQEQARAEIEREKQSALDTLRAEVADLAIQAAEKILHETLDADRQRRLVETFIDELPKN
ncbi:MAG: ATP synthase F0 subunit B [Bacteroidetes bacterium]|nr:MAG: ATP synthase F0 subunit B [Bacteroidota bacterium]GIV58123.1 MAG: ATP synthase subunit b [Rhodothermaceae bacterium]